MLTGCHPGAFAINSDNGTDSPDDDNYNYDDYNNDNSAAGSKLFYRNLTEGIDCNCRII